MPTEREKAGVLLTGDPKTLNLLTMGLFQYYKWDQIRSKEAGHTLLNSDEISAIADAVTERRWKDYEQAANKTLREITASEDKWLTPIIQGVISAFLYSLILVFILLIIQHFDIDVFNALGIESRIVIERPGPLAPVSSPKPGSARPVSTK